MDQSGIHNSEDNRKLERGKDNCTKLEKAIQKSRVYIIVKRNYSNSSWSLEELVKIVESNPQHIGVPVFYQGDPSHLQSQWGILGFGFSQFQVAFNFLNQLTYLDLRLCRRFQSPDELPTGLQAMDASNTMSLECIFTGLNWKLSKQLECSGCSKVLQKNRTSNPKNKLLNVSLLSLFLFDRIWFLDHTSLLMILMY